MNTTKEVQQQEPLWRVWIDNRQRIVSFHEQADACLMEFRNQDLFWSCVEQYRDMRYRYQ